MAEDEKNEALKGGGKNGAVLTQEERLKAWNRFRENLNPVRGLTIRKAASLIESYARGEFANLMWTFGAPFMGIETADEDLSAIIGRRTDALVEMDWNAKENTGDRVDPVLAEEQAAFIDELCNGIEDSLYDAIEHLAIAFNRGFAHCEIIETYGGTVKELRPVDQWNVVRRGMHGSWKYNPDAQQTSWDSLPADNELDSSRFVFHEVPRPVGRVALTKFIRANMGAKDWDAFIEIYGLPGGVVIGPPNVAPEKEALYQAWALAAAKGGSGYLPYGAQYICNDSPRGSQPFESHGEYLTKKLVLVGTGGLLTMLAESGSGTLAGSVHAQAFQQLARGDARRIGTCLQRSLVAPRLRKLWPGKPISAKFQMAFREEVDSAEVIEDVVKLSGVGWRMDTAELEDKTGYKFAESAQSKVPEGGSEAGMLANRLARVANRLRLAGLVTEAEMQAGALQVKYEPILKNREPVKTGDSEPSGNQDNTGALVEAMGELLQAARVDDAQALRDHLGEVLALPDEELPGALLETAEVLPMMVTDADQATAAWSKFYAAVLGQEWDVAAVDPDKPKRNPTTTKTNEK